MKAATRTTRDSHAVARINADLPESSATYNSLDLRLRDIQNHSVTNPLTVSRSILSETPMEIVSLGVVDDVPLLITRTEVTVRDQVSQEIIKQYYYNLYTTYDHHHQWRPDSRLVESGVIRLSASYLDGENAYPSKSSVRVVWSEINSDLQGRGIGKFFYKTAINDLIDEGYLEVYSDSLYQQSPEAQRLWQSLERSNPDRITTVYDEEEVQDKDETYDAGPRYQVLGYLQRRPVHVRSHRRRA